MKQRNPILINILLIITAFTFLLTGCGQSKKVPIVIINDKKLYMDDFLYEIYLVESEGNQLEEYYQDKLGYSYWDYDYDGTTMRELAKNSVMTSVVMYEILSDQAKQKGMELTKDELSDNEKDEKELLNQYGENNLDKVGLTKEVLSDSLSKFSLGDKYKSLLCKDFNINEASIRDSIHKSDYKNTDQYEQAVADAVQEEEDLRFEDIYNQIKKQYDITINFDLWDTVTIGTITDALR